MAKQPNETHILLVQFAIASVVNQFSQVHPADIIHALRLQANEIESKIY